MTAEQAKTVLGLVPTAQLGVTNSHDHLFLSTPALPGQELADAAVAELDARMFFSAGGRTVVQWTPAGLGRRVDDLVTVSHRSGLHIIVATGRHRRPFYHPDARIVLEDDDELTARFVDDITRRRCGLIKVGTGYWTVDPFEQASLRAAAQAHHETGVPIAVHLEAGTAADLVLDHLTDLAVPTSAVIVGHLGRNPDAGYVREVAQSGAFLCFDGPSRANHATDWRLSTLLQTLVEQGHTQQILLGGDTTTRQAVSDREGPGMTRSFRGLTAGVTRRLGQAVTDAISVANPARAWAQRPAPDHAATDI